MSKDEVGVASNGVLEIRILNIRSKLEVVRVDANYCCPGAVFNLFNHEYK